MQVLAPAIHLYQFSRAGECLNLLRNPNLYKSGFVDYGLGSVRPTRITSIFNPAASLIDPAATEGLNILDTSIEPIIFQYRQTFQLEELTQETRWILMKYDKGNYFDLHKDEDPFYDRTVSVVAYLNDGYEGGEVGFPEFGVSTKPKAGDVLVFPSSFAYRHSVKPVVSGVKYAAANWYRYSSRGQSL